MIELQDPLDFPDSTSDEEIAAYIKSEQEAYHAYCDKRDKVND